MIIVVIIIIIMIIILMFAIVIIMMMMVMVMRDHDQEEEEEAYADGRFALSNLRRSSAPFGWQWHIAILPRPRERRDCQVLGVVE